MNAWFAPQTKLHSEKLGVRIINGLWDWLNRFRLTTRETLLACFTLSLLIALADYLFGPDLAASITYAIPVLIAAWFVGTISAFSLSVLNVFAWSFLSYLPLHPGDVFGTVGGALIRLFIFNAFAAVLVRLNNLQRNLESLAEARAHALMNEAAERARLERELLETSEREQQRIGRDLHDGLCQHLAGTALASQLLADSLSDEESIKRTRARKIVDLLEEAIQLARSIVRGLHPIETQADGLMQALEEFASTTSRLFGIKCRFNCPVPVLIDRPTTASHLYRIVQESVNNAIRHGLATDIDIALAESEAGISLCVKDDGKGFGVRNQNHEGIGLRSMSARAKLMNGEFSVASRITGTTMVCLIPAAEAAIQTNISQHVRRRSYAKT